MTESSGLQQRGLHRNGRVFSGFTGFPFNERLTETLAPKH